MPRYRVGEGGVRVIRPNGTYSLPPGAVVDELPHRYEGELREIQGDGTSKRLDGYADKMLRPIEDKGL